MDIKWQSNTIPHSAHSSLCSSSASSPPPLSLNAAKATPGLKSAPSSPDSKNLPAIPYGDSQIAPPRPPGGLMQNGLHSGAGTLGQNHIHWVFHFRVLRKEELFHQVGVEEFSLSFFLLLCDAETGPLPEGSCWCSFFLFTYIARGPISPCLDKQKVALEARGVRNSSDLIWYLWGKWCGSTTNCKSFTRRPFSCFDEKHNVVKIIQV